MDRLVLLCAGLVAAVVPSAAGASEIFGGVYVHDVDTPLSQSGVEDGADLMLGWRGGTIGGTPLQPYLFGTLNTAGEHSYAAAGLSARFGDRIFVRPGLALAVHTGSARDFEDPDNGEIDFGSRVLFAPEIAVGASIGPRASIEASWIHMSHGQLFGRQNPGTDHFGLRLSYRL